MTYNRKALEESQTTVKIKRSKIVISMKWISDFWYESVARFRVRGGL